MGLVSRWLSYTGLSSFQAFSANQLGSDCIRGQLNLSHVLTGHPSKYEPCSRLLNASDSVRTGRKKESTVNSLRVIFLMVAGCMTPPWKYSLLVMKLQTFEESIMCISELWPGQDLQLQGHRVRSNEPKNISMHNHLHIWLYAQTVKCL